MRLLIYISTNVGHFESLFPLFITVIYDGRGNFNVFIVMFMLFLVRRCYNQSIYFYVFDCYSRNLTTLSFLPSEMPSLSKLEEICEFEKETKDLLPCASRLCRIWKGNTWIWKEIREFKCLLQEPLLALIRAQWPRLHSNRYSALQCQVSDH
jgi:hypothetical protein